MAAGGKAAWSGKVCLPARHVLYGIWMWICGYQSVPDGFDSAGRGGAALGCENQKYGRQGAELKRVFLSGIFLPSYYDRQSELSDEPLLRRRLLWGRHHWRRPVLWGAGLSVLYGRFYAGRFWLYERPVYRDLQYGDKPGGGCGGQMLFLPWKRRQPLRQLTEKSDFAARGGSAAYLHAGRGQTGRGQTCPCKICGS